MTTRVGVFIPAYNGAKYIASAIQSVLQQTSLDYELWVVDDCSTDSTRSIVETFHDSRIHLVCNRQNLGLTRNWNRCMELAETDLILILHQDDCLSHNMLADVVRFYDIYPALGLVSTGAKPIDRNGGINRWIQITNRRYRTRGDSRVLAAGAESVLYLIQYGVAISGIVVPRAVYENIGKFDTSLPYSPDEEMWARIGAHYPIGLLPSTIVYQRNHSSQFRNETSKRKDFLLQYLEVQRRRFAFLSIKEQRAYGGEEYVRRLAANAGPVIALRSLADGDFDLAQYYLDATYELLPAIVTEPKYRIARFFCLMPRIGQLIFQKLLRLD